MFEFFFKIADRQVAKDIGDYCQGARPYIL